MQKPIPQTRPGRAWWPASLASRPAIRLGIAAILVLLLGGGIWLVYLHAQPQVIVTNGADRWANDQHITPAAIPFASPETLQIPVDPAFTAYYQAHAGAKLLGAPVTPGFPIAQGWIQFFTANALLLPGKHPAATASKSQAEKQIDSLIQDGLKDPRTGIMQLPLLHTLLTVGSQARVGGGLTYADLRNAMQPNQMIPAPATGNILQSASGQGTFIQTGARDGQKIGHVIPPALWAFITRPDVSPDGWQTDFGAPLTGAIPFGNVQYSVSHRLLIQVFWRGALVIDRDARDASGQPIIQPLDTGVAYLQTLTPPAPALGARTSIWTSSSLDLLSAPGTGSAVLHVSQHFPLTLTGKAQWSAGTLWYHVKWQAPRTSGTGWAPASGTTFTAPKTTSNAASAPAGGMTFSVPGNPAAWASFDQLSPGLAQYLASQGNNTAAVVYDLTRQRYYTYHLNNQYLMGNSIKVPVLLAFLAMVEQQGRRPTSDELQQLTTMMNTVDGDTNEELYNAIGRSLGLTEYLNQLGITGLEPDYDNWNYSMTKPLAMVQLLTLLAEGKVLTPQDRALVFSLLKNSAPDQQVGVGDTRPQGASVAMKDGWVMGTDDRWTMNTSGIVTVGDETYVISVYSAHLNTLADGQSIARQVCASVAAYFS
jgi:beta-lactamase class A